MVASNDYSAALPPSFARTPTPVHRELPSRALMVAFQIAAPTSFKVARLVHTGRSRTLKAMDLAAPAFTKMPLKLSRHYLLICILRLARSLVTGR